MQSLCPSTGPSCSLISSLTSTWPVLTYMFLSLWRCFGPRQTQLPNCDILLQNSIHILNKGFFFLLSFPCPFTKHELVHLKMKRFRKSHALRWENVQQVSITCLRQHACSLCWLQAGSAFLCAWDAVQGKFKFLMKLEEVWHKTKS